MNCFLDILPWELREWCALCDDLLAAGLDAVLAADLRTCLDATPEAGLAEVLEAALAAGLLTVLDDGLAACLDELVDDLLALLLDDALRACELFDDAFLAAAACDFFEDLRACERLLEEDFDFDAAFDLELELLDFALLPLLDFPDFFVIYTNLSQYFYPQDPFSA